MMHHCFTVALPTVTKMGSSGAKAMAARPRLHIVELRRTAWGQDQRII
jgi:hypothetical protein